jgi:type I restriction enzyme R subunit
MALCGSSTKLVSPSDSQWFIVCTIQKLGLALDENSKRSKRSKQQKKGGKKSFKEQLEPLRDKRIAFIFDECHRSQFGENHKAIKELFPRANSSASPERPSSTRTLPSRRSKTRRRA